jgi:hypothetical protein
MSNTKREPLLSDDDIHDFCDDEAEDFGIGDGPEFAAMQSIAKDVRLHYEAARAKDAELIQMLVDDLRILRIEFGNSVGQTTEIGIASLSAAEADGFNPSDSSN